MCVKVLSINEISGILDHIQNKPYHNGNELAGMDK